MVVGVSGKEAARGLVSLVREESRGGWVGWGLGGGGGGGECITQDLGKRLTCQHGFRQKVVSLYTGLRLKLTL